MRPMARAHLGSAPASASTGSISDRGAASSASDAVREALEAEEAAALAAYLDGDTRPLGRVLHRHQKGVYNFCLRMLGHRGHAEDATQEVFLKVVRAAERYEPSAKVRTWIYAIARNHCIDELRKAAHRKTDSLDRPLRGEGEGGATLGSTVAAPAVTEPDRGAEAERLRIRLARALASLPEEQREVFIMREQAGLPFKEIAVVVGAPENTVKSRMRYALEALRLALARDGVTAEDAKP